MLKARPHSRTHRSRPTAGALRPLWLAAVLLAFLCAHGMGVPDGGRYPVPEDRTVAGGAAAGPVHGAPAEERDGHGPAHDAPDCVPVQPSPAPAPHVPGGCLPAYGEVLPGPAADAAAGGAAVVAPKPPGTVMKGVVLRI
ncbi:hypothetical protein NPS70_03420 [Streptomyces sp. C10-9-1]|uniref:hypothetical protein n=1 Tax=Streptomyces sp. C10-9-1 TaxID=1859285 RepID=UPI0021132C89|nr:hypothetical protein [Streptomyces sp. C10-9-1]MCQ6552253.1 hypothetical protein [Streptomyces sp. C10-9-1]